MKYRITLTVSRQVTVEGDTDEGFIFLEERAKQLRSGIISELEDEVSSSRDLPMWTQTVIQDEESGDWLKVEIS